MPIAIAVLWLTGAARLGAAGESCERTADCVEPLGCYALVCQTRPAAPPAAAQTAPVREMPRRRARPVTVPYHEGDPIPEGATVVTRSRVALWASGIAVLAASYVISASTTNIACSKGCVPWAAPVAWIPVAGPFIDLGASASNYMPFLIISGLAQAGGVAMIVLGTVMPNRVLVMQAGPVSATLVPSGNGAAVVGAF